MERYPRASIDSTGQACPHGELTPSLARILAAMGPRSGAFICQTWRREPTTGLCVPNSSRAFAPTALRLTSLYNNTFRGLSLQEKHMPNEEEVSDPNEPTVSRRDSVRLAAALALAAGLGVPSALLGTPAMARMQWKIYKGLTDGG